MLWKLQTFQLMKGPWLYQPEDYLDKKEGATNLTHHIRNTVDKSLSGDYSVKQVFISQCKIF